jgi:hypothetical protein
MAKDRSKYIADWKAAHPGCQKLYQDRWRAKKKRERERQRQLAAQAAIDIDPLAKVRLDRIHAILSHDPVIKPLLAPLVRVRVARGRNAGEIIRVSALVAKVAERVWERREDACMVSMYKLLAYACQEAGLVNARPTVGLREVFKKRAPTGKKRGRPPTGRKAYNIRMLPTTYQELCVMAATDRVGDMLDRLVAQIMELDQAHQASDAAPQTMPAPGSTAPSA